MIRQAGSVHTQSACEVWMDIEEYSAGGQPKVMIHNKRFMGAKNKATEKAPVD